MNLFLRSQNMPLLSVNLFLQSLNLPLLSVNLFLRSQNLPPLSENLRCFDLVEVSKRQVFHVH